MVHFLLGATTMRNSSDRGILPSKWDLVKRDQGQEEATGTPALGVGAARSPSPSCLLNSLVRAQTFSWKVVSTNN